MLIGVVFCRGRQMRRRNTDNGPVKRRVLKNKSKVGRATPLAPARAADLPGMQLIVDWLKQLGMHEYIQHFVENDIDFAILDNLTDQDLEKIGVTSLGHRRKLLHAIANLKGTEKSAPATAVPAAPPIGPQVVDTAERRQVTVMFSDLVGSTALSARMDPEDLREVISTYQKCVAEVVRRFGGFIAKYMGDGVLVYFGYPHAHEDDAERAIRAGLELIAAVSVLRTRASLQTRIGIATGLVVVGDLVGSGEAQERGIVGETPNLAARMQGIAEPNQVVIADSTRRLLGNLFEFADLGSKDLKGIATATRAWAALRPRSIESRFEALHASDLTDFVGREEELELLARRWTRSKIGEGQIVLLSGEPGIGKSRLIAELLERLVDEPHGRLRYFCSPQHNDSALYPIISQIERAAAYAHDDAAQTKINKLDTLLAQSFASRADAALFAEMLSVPNDGRYPELDLTPQQRRQRTFEALIAQLEKLASHHPVLMIFEDIHWIDPTSLEVLNRTVDRIKTLPVLLIVTFRPEFNAPWTGQSRVTNLTLNRLEEPEAAAIVARVTGNKVLPENLMAEIVGRTDGIPLFVEEMTKAVLEAQNEAAAPAPTVPASLQGSLMARLDRLGPAKEVAQIGSAIGREFSYALLAAVVRKSEAELGSALNNLVAAGLLLRQGVPPHSTYLFKHALVQDAAYGTLLREPRRALHGRIVETLENQFTDIAKGQPELLAQHCDAAELFEKATLCWRAAGEQAAHRGANIEAIEHFQRALLRNTQRSESTDRLRMELAILSQLGPALMSIHGWAAPAVGEALKRATNVARQLEASRDLASPLTSLWLFRYARGELNQSDEISDELFRIARKLDDREVTLQAHHTAAPSQWIRGFHLEANKHFETCLALYDEDRDVQHRYRYIGHDPAVCAMTVGASVKWALGFPDEAARMEQRALVLARRLQHIPSLAHALSFNAQSQALRRDVAAVAASAGELLPICQEYKLAQPEALAMIDLGWALVHLGDAREGFARLAEGLDQLDRIGVRIWLSRARRMNAEAYLAARRYDEGLQEVSRAIDIAKEIGVQGDIPRLYLLKGELLLRAPGQNLEMTESFRSALEAAEAQGARGWVLRAMTSMAGLLAERGERALARDRLAAIYADFEEGFDTPDLRDARLLVDQLS
jgi:class 3 adenylate cyclase/tetratricopeptide (TPR) repeat protein